MKYKLAYATGSRADYGIVRKYLTLLNSDENIVLDLLVTGALLEKEYGYSCNLIENDGFNIAFKAPLELKTSLNSEILNSMSVALKKFGNYFEENRYDLLILLGDRYEILSIAIAAAMNRIPILHIHGGEITLGNYDEFIRHSITKMSYFHFTSTEDYKKRVIQLGENPKNVFNIGSMGSENCFHIDINKVPTEIKVLKKKGYFVVLFHPETLTCVSPSGQIKSILQAIDYYYQKYKFVFIGTNADTGSNAIRDEINNYIQNNRNTLYFENLHPDGYHYLVKNAIALIGNSSSGIIEAPSLGTYTINIGDRQKGRVKGESVIDVKCETEEIKSVIAEVVKKPIKNRFENPYYKKNSSQLAYIITKKIIKSKIRVKEFYDIDFEI